MFFFIIITETQTLDKAKKETGQEAEQVLVESIKLSKLLQDRH